MTVGIGERMKGYERAQDFKLMPKTAVIVRVDGRAFHGLKLEQPFDARFQEAMLRAATMVAEEMGGCFRLGYVQSDEASFYLSDTATFDSQPWFGNSLQKVVSISASAMTTYFDGLVELLGIPVILPMFDARAFNMPVEDVPNYFLWRQQDWNRNSLTMLARAYFSQKELHGKKRTDMHEMLHSVGQNWAKLPAALKDGTYLFRTPDGVGEKIISDPGYEAIRELMELRYVKPDQPTNGRRSESGRARDAQSRPGGNVRGLSVVDAGTRRSRRGRLRIVLPATRPDRS